MAKGISLHIGLNFFDPAHYGSNGQLNACENDARDMALIAEAQGFTSSKTLLREDATRNNVIAAIQEAAQSLQSGDIFFLTYSGHGSQLPDFNSDEEDNRDETWCLFDAQLVDDELFNLWKQFEAGVRILVLSDSCHSGSVTKELSPNTNHPTNVKAIDLQQAFSVYGRNRAFYGELFSKMAKTNPNDIKATVLLISGCQDNQFSYDGFINSTFTAQLKKVWNGGKFKHNYYVFHKRIQQGLPSHQSPNLLVIGAPNRDFEHQIPFSI